MSETQENSDVPVQKEKKPRTPAQIAAWEKAQATRIANAKAKQDRKTTEYVSQKIETLKKKLPEKIQEVNSETDEEEETKITVVRVPAKPKPKPKKKEIRVELQEEGFSEEEEAVITKPKIPIKEAPLPVVKKQSPVAPTLYFV